MNREAAHYEEAIGMVNNDLQDIRDTVGRFGVPRYGSFEWLPEIERATSPGEALARRWIRREPSSGSINMRGMKHENTRLERVNEDLLHRIEQLEGRVGNVAQLNRQVEVLRATLQQRENELVETTEANVRLSQGNDILTADNENLDNQLTDARRTIQKNVRITEENSNLFRENTDLARGNRDLERQNAHLQADVNNSHALVNRLQRGVANRDNQLRISRQAIAGQQGELDASRAQVAEMQHESHQQQERINRLEKRVRRLRDEDARGQLNRANARIEELEAELKVRRKSIQRLSNDIEQLRSNGSRGRLQVLELEVIDQRREVRRLNGELNRLNADNKELEHRNRALKRTYGQLRADLKERRPRTRVYH
jgi:predicted RNase H-like nuclease (RuvC/YqgF family)